MSCVHESSTAPNTAPGTSVPDRSRWRRRMAQRWKSCSSSEHRVGRSLRASRASQWTASGIQSGNHPPARVAAGVAWRRGTRSGRASSASSRASGRKESDESSRKHWPSADHYRRDQWLLGDHEGHQLPRHLDDGERRFEALRRTAQAERAQPRAPGDRREHSGQHAVGERGVAQ